MTRQSIIALLRLYVCTDEIVIVLASTDTL